MKDSLDIQFISDVMCPWCVIGLGNLNIALEQLDDQVDADITFQPFELNPDMPPEGQALSAHLIEKYAITEEQSEQNRDLLKARGDEINFRFNFSPESRMRNSFDAHRLLHWAKLEGKQAELKSALFKAHFTYNQDISDYKTLTAIAADIGLSPQAAKGVLEKNHYADDVRRQEAFWQQNGIHSVPTIIVNKHYAISGGQPAEQFKQALEEILAKQRTSQEA